MQQEWKSVISAIILWITMMVMIIVQFVGCCYLLFSRTSYIDALLSETKGWDEVTVVIREAITTDLPNGKRSLPYLYDTITTEWVSDEILLLLDDLKQYMINPNPTNVPSLPFYKLKTRLANQIEKGTEIERQAFAEFCLTPLPDKANWSDFASVAPLNQAAQYYKSMIKCLIGLTVTGIGLCIAICWLHQWDKQECKVWMGAIFMSVGLMGLLASGGIYFIQSKLNVINELEKMAEGIGFSSMLVRQLLQKTVNDFLEKIVTISMSEAFFGLLLINRSKLEYKSKLVRIK